MPKHQSFHNQDPVGSVLPDPQLVRDEFARRLSAAMDAKAWNQSELARQAALHLEGKSFGRHNVSAYIRGISIPGPVYLSAMAKALGVEPRDLLPERMTPSVDSRNLPIDVRDAGDGKAWLRVNKTISWPVALEVLRLVNEDTD